MGCSSTGIRRTARKVMMIFVPFLLPLTLSASNYQSNFPHHYQIFLSHSKTNTFKQINRCGLHGAKQCKFCPNLTERLWLESPKLEDTPLNIEQTYSDEALRNLAKKPSICKLICPDTPIIRLSSLFSLKTSFLIYH